MARKSIKNALLELLAFIPVSVVVALVLMVAVTLLVLGAYIAFSFFGS